MCQRLRQPLPGIGSRALRNLLRGARHHDLAAGRPTFRPKIDNPIGRFDDIMDALNPLDGETADNATYGKFINRARRWKDLYRSDRGGRSLFA